jgi:ATP-binding cassette subfamily C protein LapB
MVIVTHKPALLHLCTRIVVVVGHQVVLDGPRDVVLQQLHPDNPAQPSTSA